MWIFVSYHHTDEYFLENYFVPTLKRYDVEAWFDLENLPPSALLSLTLQDRIRECAFLVIILSHLRRIYSSATAAEAEQHLQELEDKWKAYPSVSQVWRRNWPRITPFFHYPPEIRRAIYTTNSVESLNRSLRKIIKVRGGFPNEEAALKLLFLALRLAAKKWTMPIHHWREALNHFTILWPERMPALERIAG